MDGSLSAVVTDAIDRESRAVIRCLAAAERAVEDGRFNVAKVLRAAAHSARVRAMNLERLSSREASPISVLEDEAHRSESEREVFAAAPVTAADAAERALLTQLRRAVESGEMLLGILRRSVQSLREHRDVMEDDVAQSLWGCHECGHVSEGELPDACPRCGALGAEFEWFGPFYAVTPERLGRRRPSEIVAMLQGNPEELARQFAGMPEERLARRPSPGEWCMKEIAGHMVDVTELFCRRLRALRGSTPLPSLDTPVPPWKLLEGKSYEAMVGHEIVDRFRQATVEALALVSELQGRDWARQGIIRGRPTNLLDLGSWLANHNLAHLKQLGTLRGS